jgi:hypothetical protein
MPCAGSGPDTPQADAPSRNPSSKSPCLRGDGVVSVGQFTVAGFAIAQFAAAYSMIAQIGVFVDQGRGQIVRSIAELMGML